MEEDFVNEEIKKKESFFAFYKKMFPKEEEMYPQESQKLNLPSRKEAVEIPIEQPLKLVIENKKKEPPKLNEFPFLFADYLTSLEERVIKLEDKINSQSDSNKILEEIKKLLVK